MKISRTYNSVSVNSKTTFRFKLHLNKDRSALNFGRLAVWINWYGESCPIAS